MTVGDLFKEWITEHAALNLSERYAPDAVGWWDREIATRSGSHASAGDPLPRKPRHRAENRAQAGQRPVVLRENNS
jgi:hypothetical protein